MEEDRSTEQSVPQEAASAPPPPPPSHPSPPAPPPPPPPSFSPPPPPPPPPPLMQAYRPETPKGGGCLRNVLIAFLVFFILFLFGVVGMGVSEYMGRRTPVVSRGNVVGVIRVDQVIYDAGAVLDSIQYYRESDSIRAILVRVDSPGGAVGAAQEIYEGLKDLRAQGKHVVVSMGNTAASGGYYIASAAEEIYANPGTLTGSIGVIIGLPNIEEINRRLGFRYESIKSGEFKDIGSITRGLTDLERELLKDVILDTHEQFVEAILAQRSEQIQKAAEAIGESDPSVAREVGPDPTAEKLLRVVADGRIFTGRQALRYGLVDRIGTEHDAVQALSRRIGVTKPRLHEYRRKRTFRDLLMSDVEAAIRAAMGLVHGARVEYRMP